MAERSTCPAAHPPCWAEKAKQPPWFSYTHHPSDYLHRCWLYGRTADRTQGLTLTFSSQVQKCSAVMADEPPEPPIPWGSLTLNNKDFSLIMADVLETLVTTRIQKSLGQTECSAWADECLNIKFTFRNCLQAVLCCGYVWASPKACFSHAPERGMFPVGERLGSGTEIMHKSLSKATVIQLNPKFWVSFLSHLTLSQWFRA